MRLIDANLAQHIANKELFYDDAGTVQWVLSHTPTIKPEDLVVKAWWEWCGDHWECTNCRGSRHHDLALGLDAAFCGRCGAKMMN